MPNKLGPHILEVTNAGRLWASRANCAKQAFGIDGLRSAQAGAMRVCRPIWRLRNDDGAQAARDIIALYDQWGYRPPITELWNEGDEIGHRLGNGLELRVQRTAEAVPIFHANGLQVAGFSFSTGVPEPEDWLYCKNQGFAGVDYLAVHEYWGTERGFTGWNALRYRRVHDWLGGNHPPMIITECGLDAVCECSSGAMCDPNHPEDRICPSGWRLTGWSGAQYVASLLAYDAELSRDSYVLGATVFTAGGGDGWFNFDVDELVPAIIGTGPPPPPPPPPPGPGSSLALLVAVLAASVAGLILVARLGPREEQEIEVTDVRELEPGEPIPPGYTVIG